ncbi:uridylate-specific endoribonuclease C-like [Ambystoma mexicanum]|uniref:uridylate-specific endoribonuclease C-like n=1 Tax=Ambystoma mexicanum TaxID=8296 RepID=UPI0037E773E8
MQGVYLCLCLLPAFIAGTLPPEPRAAGNQVPSLYAITDTEIRSLSEELYSADVNKADPGDIVLNLQHQVPSSETGSGQDYASKRLFDYVDENKLFSRPTFARLQALLDNYERKTGTAEVVPSYETEEQEAFLDEIFKTQVISKLYNFFSSKGIYQSQQEFKRDLKEMWFGLYTRSKGPLDSSGFEHVFHGEIKSGKISGLHNWVQLYLLEKSGQANYLSYSYNGPWTSFPDVMAFQYKWSTYLKSVGSFYVGSSPEFDIAVYTLCYVTRPDKLCDLRIGGKTSKIQTYSWTNSTYGDGKRYVASSYPNV